MMFTSGSKVITGPTTEPITQTDAKNWLKVDTTADDDLITSLIAATREHIEAMTGLALFTQTVQEKLNWWPEFDSVTNPFQAFNLLRYPVQSITSITYLDSDGNSQTFAAENYVLNNTTGNFASIGLAADKSWPSIRNQLGAITVNYIAGWATVGEIPEDLKIALKLLLAYFYERRADGIKQYPSIAENLINKHYIQLT